MSAHDTLRWGDSATILNLTSLNNESISSAPTVLVSKQLVAAHWKWPLVWVAQFVVLPNLKGETVTFNIALSLQVGVGQAMATLVRNYQLAPPYNTLTQGIALTPNPGDLSDQWSIPAQDIQAQVQVTTEGNTPLSGDPGETLTVSMFVAPMTEPHAGFHMYERVVEHKNPDEVRWLGEGLPHQPFTPERLKYRR
jgi:hypothetical protein